MTFAHITKEAAVQLLTHAVEEKGGDYIYPKAKNGGTCSYFTDEGAPSCIVGNVISQVGLSPEGLKDYIARRMDEDEELDEELEDEVEAEFDMLNSDTSVSEFVSVLEAIGLKLDEDAVEVLQRAQEAQDGGIPWGEAVSGAAAGITYNYGVGPGDYYPAYYDGDE